MAHTCNLPECVRFPDLIDLFFHNGSMGVDIFFVLSGFLIGYILFKECDKYDGKIDIINFYRSRFIRIWFAEAAYLLCFCPFLYNLNLFDQKLTWITCFVFLNNIGQDSRYIHLWSIAVEF